MVKSERIRLLRQGPQKQGPVIYWMSRDQRAEDNWALLYAQQIANELNQPLAVVFTMADSFPGATLRHYDFMIKGLQETSEKLNKKNIPFYPLHGEPSNTLADFIKEYNVMHVIADFDPLRIKREWKKELIRKVECSFYEVDAHNIVPCLVASDKREFGAYTLRPKIKKLLPLFVDEFHPLENQADRGLFKLVETDWKLPECDTSVEPVKWILPGESKAREMLNIFLSQKLSLFNEKRNDPNESVSSNLSPYLHFGQISAQRVALEIMKNLRGNENTDSFLEEMIVRRELSDNYCYYNTAYDSFAGFPEWARKTLDDHRMDEREYTYSLDQFMKGATHDPLWNAAQLEMVKSGKMHGYMRMYWAKKILEWTSSPEEALHFSISLNDRFQLDGRDPNGYVGCAWSIGGVHDRAWTERPVYGKIRYMNYNGCKRKFDVEKYIKKWI